MQAEETTRTARSIIGIPAAKRSPRKAQLVLSLMMTTAIATIGVAYPVSADAQTAATGQTSRIALDILAQPLSRALVQFSNATGAQLFFDANLVRGRNSPAVRGSLTRSEALGQLLAGSGLIYRVSGNTVTITSSAGANAGVGVDDGSLVLDTITVQGQGESAWGPVDGYVATRSAIGTKTGAPLIETPQSISVVGRQEMEDRGVQTLNEALIYTPGINTSINGQVDNGWDAIRLRGFDYPGQYMDGLLSSNGWIEPYGTERIEVLRGPASILFGAASPGGVIGATSKRPTEHTIREVGILTSEFGGIQGQLDLSGKATEDGTLLYRLTALGKDLGAGYAADDLHLKRIYVAPAITWRPSADTSLTILAKYQYDPDFPSNVTWPRAGTIWPRADGFRFHRDMYQSDPAFDDHSYRKQTHLGYLFEHDFSSNWTVRQNLRLSRSELDRNYLLGSTNSNNSILRRTSAQRQHELTDTFAVDNQLLGRFETGALSHSTIFGLDYRRIELRQQSGRHTNSMPSIDLRDPVYGIISGPKAALTSGTDQTNFQTGVYAQDQIKWGGLSVLLGGRYDWASSRTWDIYSNRNLTSEIHQSKFTYRLGAVYELENGIAPYISYSTSFEPQTGTTGPERGSTPFDPTTGRQVEVGVKFSPTWFNGFFTAAYFDLKRQNVITADPEYEFQSIQYGEVQSKGFEFSAVGHITDEFRFVAQYTYLDSKVTKGYPYPWEEADPVGKVPDGIPMHTASLWGHYTFLDGALEGLGLGAGVRFVGSSWGDTENTFKVSSFTVVDAALHYDFGKKVQNLKGLNLAITAQNLFDKEYINSCVGNICAFGAGRRITGSLVYRW